MLNAESLFPALNSRLAHLTAHLPRPFPLPEVPFRQVSTGFLPYFFTHKAFWVHTLKNSTFSKPTFLVFLGLVSPTRFPVSDTPPGSGYDPPVLCLPSRI